MSRSYLCMSLYQKVFVVKYYYKLGEDLHRVWEAFQGEFRSEMPPDVFHLIPQLIASFETTGSVLSDFYYRKSGGGTKDSKAEIMYLPVGDVQEETVIETDQDLMEQQQQQHYHHEVHEVVEELEEEEEGEEVEELTEEDEGEGEEEEMLETKVDPNAVIAAETSTEASDSSDTESESDSDADTDVSFKPSSAATTRKGPPRVTIRPIKHLQQQQQQQNSIQNTSMSSRGKQQQQQQRISGKTRRSPSQKFCDICKKFVRACFSEHMATHNSSKDFICKTCDKSFSTVRYLKEHMQTHEEGKFVCEVCGKVSKTKSNYNSHSKVHTTERKFECNLCPLKFLRQQGLRRHMLTHTGEKPYKCRHCTQEFALYMTHQMHERLHTGERPYKCQHCEKSFIGAPALNVRGIKGKFPHSSFLFNKNITACFIHRRT